MSQYVKQENLIKFNLLRRRSPVLRTVPVQCNTVILQYLHFLLFLKNCTFHPPAALAAMAEYIQYIHKGQVETFSSDSSESSMFYKKYLPTLDLRTNIKYLHNENLTVPVPAVFLRLSSYS